MTYAARASDSFISSSKTWLQVSGLVRAARVLLPSLTVASPHGNLDNEVTHRPERRRKLARQHRLSTRESSVFRCIFRIFCGVRRSGLFYRHELRLARSAPNQFPQKETPEPRRSARGGHHTEGQICGVPCRGQPCCREVFQLARR